jgi:hypothetical protein
MTNGSAVTSADAVRLRIRFELLSRFTVWIIHTSDAHSAHSAIAAGRFRPGRFLPGPPPFSAPIASYP